MQQISINEYLNSSNPWAKRLLGMTEFSKNRNVQQIENEYNLDKYAKLLAVDLDSMEAYKALEFEQAGMHPVHGQMIISKGDDVFKATVHEARTEFYSLIKSTVNKYTAENICELGCGYGFNLTLLGANAYGGEYSKNAVALGQKLGYDVSEFNYYTAADYDFIKPNTTIFTTHSIEQIPDATVIIENLEKQKHKINYVVHFEPTVINERTSLMGLMRNKYMELNDYNRNLLYVLQSRTDIEIVELTTDILGLVPLNTTNLIVWKFKK